MRITDLPASAEDYRFFAKRRLPRLMFDYIEGGSYSEQTAARNTVKFAELLLRQRVMRDVSRLHTEIELFGQKLSMPLLLGPVGLAGMYARRGEAQAARAAAGAGIPFCLSTVSICDIAEVTAAGGTPIWFQVYVIKDRTFMRDLIGEARRHGVRALVLTVDVPKPGARHRDTRSGMYGGLPLFSRTLQAAGIGSHLHWMWNVYVRGRPHLFGNVAPAMPHARTLADFWAWIKANMDASVGWHDVAWLREQWDGPIIVKGIMAEEDALAAISAGADGIVVSNHGGRQLDGMAASIELLPRIADTVAGRVPVLFDSGVRTGLDILKALASGAQACLVGRNWAYALGAGGQKAVSHMIELMRGELEMAMMMTGCTDVRSAGRELIELEGRGSRA